MQPGFELRSSNFLYFLMFFQCRLLRSWLASGVNLGGVLVQIPALSWRQKCVIGPCVELWLCEQWPGALGRSFQRTTDLQFRWQWTKQLFDYKSYCGHWLWLSLPGDPKTVLIQGLRIQLCLQPQWTGMSESGVANKSNHLCFGIQSWLTNYKWPGWSESYFGYHAYTNLGQTRQGHRVVP